MLEVIRRVLFAGCLLGAIWLFAYARPAAVNIHEPDFSRRYKNAARWDKSLSFEQFVEKETGGSSSLRLEGKPWQEWRQRIVRFFAGGQSDPELKRHAARGYLQEMLFFASDDPKVASFASVLCEKRPHVYLAFDGPGRTNYLSATLKRPGDYSDAPAWIAYPYQRLGLAILLLGLLAYIVLPWKRSGGDTFRYSRLQGAILPDLVGVLLGGAFFAIPLFVCTRDSLMAHFVIEQGYFGVTLVALVLSLGGIVSWGVSAWYASVEIRALPDRLRFSSLTRSEDYLYSEIAGVEPFVYKPSRWLKVARTLAFLSGNWRAAAAMTAGTQEHPGLLIRAQDGRSRHFSLTGFPGAARLLLLLRDNQIPVAQEALDLVFGEDPVPERAGAPLPQRSALRWQLSALAVLAVLASAVFARQNSREQAWLQAALPVRTPPPSKAKVLAQGRILKQMSAVQAEMSQATRQLEHAPAKERPQAVARSEKALAKFNALQKQYEELEKHPPADDDSSEPLSAAF